MLAYRLRHRIAFQKKIEITDMKTGERTYNWVTATTGDVSLGCVPAEVLTGAGSEAVRNASPTADVAARINVRWFPGLDPAWRIVWDGLIFHILSWDSDITGRKDLRIKCTAYLDK